MNSDIPPCLYPLRLDINSGQQSAHCPRCDKIIDKDNPLIKQESEIGFRAQWFMSQPPRCPHCYQQLEIYFNI